MRGFCCSVTALARSIAHAALKLNVCVGGSQVAKTKPTGCSGLLRIRWSGPECAPQVGQGAKRTTTITITATTTATATAITASMPTTVTEFFGMWASSCIPHLKCTSSTSRLPLFSFSFPPPQIWNFPKFRPPASNMSSFVQLLMLQPCTLYSMR